MESKYFWALGLSMCLVLPAQAAKPEWAGKHAGKAGQHQEQTADEQAEYPDAERGMSGRHESGSARRLILDYYHNNDYRPSRLQPEALSGLPRGLQKKLQRTGELPPGWQRKLQPGQPLSPELGAFAEPLPADLEALIPQAERYRRINDRIVRLSSGEGRVLDVIYLLDDISNR